MSEPILGPSQTTILQCQSWLESRGCRLTGVLLVPTFFEVCPRVGVRPEVAIAQFAKETGFCYRYTSKTSVLNESFHNPCGLKTLRGGDNYDPDAHWRPDDWDIGILGQAEHLAKYAGSWAVLPPYKPVDPRFGLVRFGSAPTVRSLSGRWAGPGYGESLEDNYLTPLLNHGVAR